LSRRSFQHFDSYAGCRLFSTRVSPEAHRRLFSSIYPWAGKDRSETAPDLAIVKAGYKTLFAHPADVRRAAEYALLLGHNTSYLRAHPGEVFALLAHAHRFLEGNGRTILPVFANLSRRAGFHIEWEAIEKDEFLRTLTEELLQPGKTIMDALVLRYVRKGVLAVEGRPRGFVSTSSARAVDSCVG
jgi:cell filamentation protein